MPSRGKQRHIPSVFARNGNLKLGKSVYAFSIPAIKTCPGRSKFCESLCYADTGVYKFRGVQRRLEQNYKLSQKPDFVRLAIQDLQACKRKNLICRIHPSGDFYSAKYINKWIKIVAACPDVTFWAYTRSWRKSNLLPALKKLAKLKNIQLWFSVDHETGKPTDKPKNVRTAYLMKSSDERPSWKPDLFFRDDHERKLILKHVNGTLLCPPENGVTRGVTCERCRVCLTNPKQHPNKRTTARDFKSTTPVGKISLEMAA